MSLASLLITDLRCLTRVEMEFTAELNLIHGPNGSGKTSILEAIFLLGRGRSFRTRHTEQLISRDRPKFVLFGQTENPLHRIGFEYQRGGVHATRIDGEDASSLAALPRAFFVEVIDPEIHRLVEGAPAERRRWLDWGVFHVEPSYLEHWSRFSRALRQRNAALKQGQDPRGWDAELALRGEFVDAHRRRWFEIIRARLCHTVYRLAGLDVEVAYQRGWSADYTLADALAESLERDRHRGATIAGPHRADIQLKANGKLARESLSRGQQKLVSAAMVLALLARLKEAGGASATLLLDDPAAELDAQHLSRLVDIVRELGCQVILTSLDSNFRAFGRPERLFHVEQGSVQRI